MSKVQVMDHPLIQHKINYIRNEEVGSKEFREIVGEIASLMCYEATRDLKMEDVKIKTPICEMTGKQLSGKKLAVVPILRAGLGMVDGMLNMIPSAKVGHIGLYRDPQTYEPVEYYCKLPSDCDEREVFVVDPMLATGGSCIAALQMLKDKGVKHLRFMCIIAAPDNKILSMGYNGLPTGCSDDVFPWGREGDDPLETKYVYTVHSELNAILNYRGGSLEGAKLYVSLFPCNECAKAIIQSGIKEVIYDCNKYEGTAAVMASMKMFDAAGVNYHKYHRTDREIKISL